MRVDSSGSVRNEPACTLINMMQMTAFSKLREYYRYRRAWKRLRPKSSGLDRDRGRAADLENAGALCGGISVTVKSMVSE